MSAEKCILCGHMAWGERVAWCPECGKRVWRS